LSLLLLFTRRSCAVTGDCAVVACLSCTISVISVVLISWCTLSSSSLLLLHPDPWCHITGTSHRCDSFYSPPQCPPTTTCDTQGRVGGFHPPGKRPSLIRVARWVKRQRIRPPMGLWSASGVMDLWNAEAPGREGPAPGSPPVR
jgi:hypothetical protein